jgi:hypothetical protein
MWRQAAEMLISDDILVFELTTVDDDAASNFISLTIFVAHTIWRLMNSTHAGPGI